jgi:tetratricopeptide (TPR) repeat protein
VGLLVHAEVTRTVAKKIRVTLTPEEQKRLGGARALNSAANEAYFRGRYFLDRRTKADFDDALTDFQQAVDLDPKFAPAYAGLSEGHLALAMYDAARGTELFAKDQDASRKALELDENLSAAHYTLATIRGSGWDWPGADVEFRRAIELDPSNALAHISYSDLLVVQGRLADAEIESQRAEELDPISLEIYGAATGHLYYARRYDELIERCQGKPDAAITELRKALRSSTMYEHTATELANALVVAGKRDEALKELDRVRNASWKAFGAALVYAGAGERDQAFRSLDKAMELRAPLVILLKVDPRFDLPRPDPRFTQLLRRMNLPE